MFFLKCNNCGHLNELTTETLLFCNQCKKKLTNNFRDWHAKNPDRTLDDFKAIYCITNNETQENIATCDVRYRRNMYWIIFAVVFSVFLVAGYFLSARMVNYFRSGKLSKTAVDKNWVTVEYGNHTIKVSTPFRLNETQLPFNVTTQSLISSAESYQSNSSSPLIILVNSFVYNSEAGTFSLQDAAKSIIAELKAQQGVTDLYYNEEYLYKGSIPGFLQHGNFIKDNVKMEFINSGFNRGFKFWQVMAVYKDDDEASKQVGERIIQSIEFINIGEY